MSGNKVILKIKPRNNINMQVLPPSLSLTDVERAENAANIAMAWAQDDESPDGENDTDSPTGKTQSSKSWALNAKNDALSAAASASAAATSETNAANSEDKAQAWAESETSPDSEPDSKSAKTWAGESSDSAELAQKWAESDESPDGEVDSKSAKTWAEEAAQSASAALSSANNAADSVTAAASSASAAASSASTATTQAGIATTKAAEAASSAAGALESKNAALTSANNAATSEENAASSATAASNSASAAAASAQEAAEIAGGIGNPVSDVTENNGTVTVVKSDGTQNTFNVVKSVNGVTPTNGNVDITGVPTGTILPFAGNTIPEGFLACNGAAISRTTYANLYAKIGTTYGTGDGSSTFNVPQVEDNRFLEFSSTRGTKKNAGLPNITGSLKFMSYGQSTSGAFTFSADGSQSPASGNNYSGVFNFNASRSSSIYGASSTVQPKSLTVRAIIKY